MVLKRVLQTFVRSAFVLMLRVGGKEIGTTSEHPFFVAVHGWRNAGELKVGDMVRLNEGWTAVEGIESTGAMTAVYNVEVEDFHTYFVGGEGWGFAVWVHNANAYKVSNDVRRGAVLKAWEEEAELVRRTGMGTRPWTDAQKIQLLEKGYVRGYVGHHINSVSVSPLIAGIPDNIEFVTYVQHLRRHGGNWRNPTSGQLLDRGV